MIKRYLVLLFGFIVTIECSAQEKHWRIAASLGDQDIGLGGIACFDETHCYASAVWQGKRQSNFYRSTDGGRTWQRTWRFDKNDSIRTPTVLSIAALSRTNLIVGSGDGSILISQDSGATFASYQLENVRAYIPFADAADSINAVAAPSKFQADVFLTSDAGSTWDTLSLPDEVDDDLLEGVEMPTPNVVLCLMNTIGSGHPLARSDDRGNTWKVFRTLPRGSYHFDFVDSLHGWVTGAGTEGSLNNDTSFIANTTDGGRTWTTQWRQRLPNGNPLTDISFADRLNGTAVGGGFYILQTTDGGATWSMDANDIPPPFVRTLYVSRAGQTSVVATQMGLILLPGPLSGHEPQSAVERATISDVHPNPAPRSTDVHLTVSTVAGGCLMLSMISSNGDVIWSDPCQMIEAGEHVLSIAFGDAHAGKYLLRVNIAGLVRVIPLVIQ